MIVADPRIFPNLFPKYLTEIGYEVGAVALSISMTLGSNTISYRTVNRNQSLSSRLAWTRQSTL